MSKIKVIALIGEAGSGKDLLLKCTCSKYTDYNSIISCTTRPKRENEEHGKDYFFISIEDFYTVMQRGDMLETTCFNGWMYGTAIGELLPHKVNIGVFNPEGVRNLLKNDKLDVRVFYVRAPAKMRLIRQLNREDNPNVDEIVRRYGTDKEDFRNLDFEYTELDNRTIQDIDRNILKIAWPQT